VVIGLMGPVRFSFASAGDNGPRRPKTVISGIQASWRVAARQSHGAAPLAPRDCIFGGSHGLLEQSTGHGIGTSRHSGHAARRRPSASPTPPGCGRRQGPDGGQGVQGPPRSRQDLGRAATRTRNLDGKDSARWPRFLGRRAAPEDQKRIRCRFDFEMHVPPVGAQAVVLLRVRFAPAPGFRAINSRIARDVSAVRARIAAAPTWVRAVAASVVILFPPPRRTRRCWRVRPRARTAPRG
jgi:hypothetical protein